MSRSIHHERPANKYAISWTTGRADPSFESGGHFYLAKYGIRIQGARNSAIVWKPGQQHGTSLINRSPRSPDTIPHVSGLAIIIPPRLPAVWKKYQEGLLAREDAAVDMGGPQEYKKPLTFTVAKSKPRSKKVHLRDPNNLRMRLRSAGPPL